MSAEIIPFVFSHDHEQTPIRVTDLNGDPWFVAADVCRGLGVTNARDALRRLKAEQKDVVLTDTPGGPQRMTIVSDMGFPVALKKLSQDAE